MCFEVKCLIFMALIDCQRRFRENNFRINVYLYGNLNGINVTFGVTVVPIQNFKLYLNILPTEKVNKGLKSLWHFECHLPMLG
ncbi:hypothetical protein DWW16_09600 [Bacteroides clarus]|nr:MAG: hypothetical protein BHV68_03380 [Bacteroidales bacterium 43_8]RGV37322.1 hypothetical protein DWW16_09600 [Bacteroides clarus]